MDRLVFTHATPRNHIFVDWDMSSICDYDCHYCNPEIHDGKVKFPDIQVAKDVVDKINLEYKDKDFAYFNLLGGEPTAWKYLDEFSYHVKKDNNKNILQLLTNGVRSLRWWKKHVKFIDRIIVSAHVAQCDIKELVSKFNTIVNEIDIDFQIAMDLKIFDKCIEYYNYALKNLDNRIGLHVKPLKVLIGGPELMPYTDQQKRIMQKLTTKHGKKSRKYGSEMMQDNNPVDIIKLITEDEENNWEGWACWIGIETINITRYGDVKIGAWCNPNLVLGNINNLDFNIPMIPVKCKYDTCGCWTDIHTTKIKNYKGKTL